MGLLMINSFQTEANIYALLTLKGRALKVGTLEGAGHLLVIMKPFGTHLVKGTMKKVSLNLFYHISCSYNRNVLLLL